MDKAQSETALRLCTGQADAKFWILSLEDGTYGNNPAIQTPYRMILDGD